MNQSPITPPADPTLATIIQHIISVINVHSIFVYRIHTPALGPIQQLYIILRSGNGPGILESRALCDRILEDYPGYRGLVFHTSDINEKNKQGNIRTLLICHPDNLVYAYEDVSKRLFVPTMDDASMLEKANQYYDKEITRIQAFEEGFRFYLRKHRLAQAGFMLHQTLELGFRTAECLLIGKEKLTHSLKNHQTHVLPFSPELGLLFSKPDELILLAKLDEAYKAARYEHNYSLSAIELISSSIKADELLIHVQHLQNALIRDIQRMKPAEAVC